MPLLPISDKGRLYTN